MKRLSILLVGILIFSINSFAKDGDEYNVLWTLKNSATANAIAEYIEATPEQAQIMDNIYYASVQRLTEALSESSKTEAQKALYFNIANAKAVLSPAQFRKYLTILNKTYYNQQNKFETATDK